MQQQESDLCFQLHILFPSDCIFYTKVLPFCTSTHHTDLKMQKPEAKSPLYKLCHLSVTHLLSQTTWISEKTFTACPVKCNLFICFHKPHNSFLTRVALGCWGLDCLEVAPWPVSRWAALTKSWSSWQQGWVLWRETTLPTRQYSLCLECALTLSKVRFCRISITGCIKEKP